MFYADGSALRLSVGSPAGSRAVTGTTASGASEVDALAWRTWLAEHEGELAVTEIGLADLRRAADPLGAEAREEVRQLTARVQVLRIPDQALPIATLTAGVLRPFAALHLGVAVTTPQIDRLVTYDRDLARLARMYSVAVLTPGRADGWWQ